MNNGKTIFSQIMSNSPEREFKACVDRYKGYYRSRNFTCKNQFLVMSYAQLTNRGSLRDIENCLTALSSRLYHCGISYAVPRKTHLPRLMRKETGESMPISLKFLLRRFALSMQRMTFVLILITWFMHLTAVPSAFVLNFALGLSFASIKEVSRCIHY